MHPNIVQVDGKARARKLIALATLLVALGIAGCAVELTGRLGGPADADMRYAGVFTGEYVDGKPLYRLPSITVFGSRNSVDSI